MKFLLALFLSSTAFADEHCTGPCWSTGCCIPNQPSKKYECTNVADEEDKIVVLKTGKILQQIKTKSSTTSL